MGYLADLLLAGGAFGAAAFCLVLSRRLKALTGLDSGLGAAIAVLSAQVDELNRALAGAQGAARGASDQLVQRTERAEAACRKLELLIAALHDLPEAEARPRQPDPEPEPAPSRARILRRRSPEVAA